MMKIFKIIIPLLAVSIITSCSSDSKAETIDLSDKVVLAGKIENRNGDTLFLSSAEDVQIAIILLNEDGSFSDTLEIEKGLYVLNDGMEVATLFLENGYNLNMTMDAKLFDETRKFEGNGAKPNNYFVESYLLEEKLWGTDLTQIDSTNFASMLNEFKQNATEALKHAEINDTAVTNENEKRIDWVVNFLTEMHSINAKYSAMKGLPSNDYTYENYAGGETSLSDFKGKFIYIDVWATWCGPCKNEIPYLKEVEEKFHGQNIEFISISVDDEKDHEAWKAMIAEKEMGGTQLFATNSWESDLAKDYIINSIPRFILIDDKGLIVDANAPRPSQPELTELLEGLLNPNEDIQ